MLMPLLISDELCETQTEIEDVAKDLSQEEAELSLLESRAPKTEADRRTILATEQRITANKRRLETLKGRLQEQIAALNDKKRHAEREGHWATLERTLKDEPAVREVFAEQLDSWFAVGMDLIKEKAERGRATVTSVINAASALSDGSLTVAHALPLITQSAAGFSPSDIHALACALLKFVEAVDGPIDRVVQIHGITVHKDHFTFADAAKADTKLLRLRLGELFTNNGREIAQ